MAKSSQRNAIAMSVGWWYLRRLIRRRGAAAVSAFVAGEGLSFASRPRKRHPVRWLVLLRVIAGAGVFWWQRAQSESVAS